MLLTIPQVLTKDEVTQIRALLDSADWEDGTSTAGVQSAQVKRNQQLPPTCEAAKTAGQYIIQALTKQARFMSAALPARILPPLFNKYELAENFGKHVDNAIRLNQLTQERLRTDMSMTLFLSEPDTYEGGELLIEDYYGQKSVKLAAGDMVLYPATSIHEVTPVTSGARVCAFFWLQSMVRSDLQRRTLFDLDNTIQSLAARLGTGDQEVVDLTGIYHNLIRQWTDV